MTIDEIKRRVAQPLSKLGLANAVELSRLLGDIKQCLEMEKLQLFNEPPTTATERERRCRALRDLVLARKTGILSQIDENWLKPAAKEWKADVGRLFNVFKTWATSEFDLEKGFQRVRIRLDSQFTDSTRVPSDLTLPGNRRALGSIHPVTRVMREIEDIFLGLGFTIETGPEIETPYYNFDALNIPESHPARDDWDTLYIDSKTLLRTHTSPVQIHAMKKHGAPLYIICPGKCYRHDNPDSSHATMFHQVEGLAVDTDITFADLKGTLDFFARKFFGEKIRTNFFPSFFPFTEPSGDVAISCTICDGQGCRVCKESGWLEVMGCGMVHPDVLEHGGIDPRKYSGWAFGLGVERFAMMKYGINDIQLFTQSDARFLEQF